MWNGWEDEKWHDRDGNEVKSYSYKDLTCWVETFKDESGIAQGFVWKAKGISAEIMEVLNTYDSIIDSDFYLPWDLESKLEDQSGEFDSS